MTEAFPTPSSTVATPVTPDDDRMLLAYDYQLPPERIAQNPVMPRDSSRLLVVNSQIEHQHRIFRDLPEILKPGDLLVVNNTRVLPARLYGQKLSGVHVEVLLLEEKEANRWLTLVKPGKRLKPGARIQFFGGLPLETPETGTPRLEAIVQSVDKPTGGRIIEFNVPSGEQLLSIIEEVGVIPLPPYITHSEAEAGQYQTVYAERPGSAAAPTAGLHFTPELLERLDAAGIEQAAITLHVGVGTFRPVESEDITAHMMHGEWLEVSAETVTKIEETKARGGRVIGVGTTVTRALEGIATQNGKLQPYSGKTDLFIYPGYEWKVLDGLITNFHLPKSSLLMLVSALIGRKRLLALYEEAIATEYRFYSFGDAMLILPEAKI
jgi:S-adenosylmethionine:tRNA ribosyltransferase-isomerase